MPDDEKSTQLTPWKLLTLLIWMEIIYRIIRPPRRKRRG